MDTKYALSLYLQSLENETTRVNYEIALKEFVGKNTKNIEDITKETILAYRKSLENKAPQTISARISAVRGFCDYCWTQGWIDMDPSLSVSVNSKDFKKYENAKNISLSDLKKLLGKIDSNTLYGKRDYLLIRMAFISGDIDKTLALKWEHSLPDSYKKILSSFKKDLLDSIPEYILDEGYVFFSIDTMDHSKPLSRSGARKILQKYTSLAGFPDKYIDWQALKRLRAKQIFEQTGSIEAVNQFCGHKSLKITQAYVKTLS